MFAKTNLNGVPCVWVDWNGPFRSGCFVKPNTFGKPRSQKRIWTRFSYLMISHAGFHENKIHRIHGWVFLHLQNASEKAEYFWGVDFHFKFLITVQPKILISKVHIQVKMRACQNLTNAAVRMMTYTNTSLPRHLLARSLGTLTRYLAFHEKCMCSSCGSLRVPVNANFCQLLRVTHSDWFIWELFLTWPFKGRSGTWNVRTSSKKWDWLPVLDLQYRNLRSMAFASGSWRIQRESLSLVRLSCITCHGFHGDLPGGAVVDSPKLLKSIIISCISLI